MKILVVAIEHSANIHLAALQKHLSTDVELVGVYEKSLGDPLYDLSDLAIMGFVDAIKKLRFFLKLSKELTALSQSCDKVLLIDSSGFNLPLAKKIRKADPYKEIIYYILPQAWAWKKKRIAVLEKTITKLCSILPFEPDYYSKNAPISYVGHPLLDEISHFKEKLSSNKLVTFMPGSRKSEIKKLMPIFLELDTQLDAKTQIVIPKHFNQENINEIYGNISNITIVHDAHKALYESDFAFICSGTATLEASLIGVPFVLTYKAKKIDYFLAKNLVKLNYIGLANIMYEKFSGRNLHPELIQDEVTVENLLQMYKNYNREQFFNDSLQLRKYLKEPSSKNVAKIIEGRDEN